MNQNEYLYVKTLSEQGSYTKAASALYISQPSLSIFIKKLEEQKGVQLFEKREGKLRLTYAGERYLEYAEKILALDTQCSMELSAISKNKKGCLVIGTTHSLVIQTMPMLLSLFHKDHPEIQIVLKEGSARSLEGMLHRNEINIALMTVPFFSRYTDYVVIRDVEVLLSVHKDNSLCSLAKSSAGLKYEYMDMNNLINVPLILLKEGKRIRSASDQLFSQINVRPKVLMETESSIAAYRMSLANIAPTFITEDLLDTFFTTKLNYYHVGNPRIIQQMICAYSSEIKLTNLEKDFIEISKQYFSHIPEKICW